MPARVFVVMTCMPVSKEDRHGRLRDDRPKGLSPGSALIGAAVDNTFHRPLTGGDRKDRFHDVR